jgi:type II secretory pathway component PulK
MSRRGFALLGVLWVLTAVTALVGIGMVVARVGADTTRNRVLLARAEWGREACGEILQARFAANPSTRTLEPIDLGRGTWCRASLDDPASRLNLNIADRHVLAALFAAVGVQPSIADSVIARRGQGTIYDIGEVGGIDSVSAVFLNRFVTTRGPGAVNVNIAPPEVLRVLPGLGEEAVAVLLGRRAARPIHNPDELAGLLSRSSRALLLDNYAEFVRVAAFGPPQLIGTIEGAVRGTPIVTRATLTLVSIPGRLAVIRRESE